MSRAYTIEEVDELYRYFTNKSYQDDPTRVLKSAEINDAIRAFMVGSVDPSTCHVYWTDGFCVVHLRHGVPFHRRSDLWNK